MEAFLNQIKKHAHTFMDVQFPICMYEMYILMKEKEKEPGFALGLNAGDTGGSHLFDTF